MNIFGDELRDNNLLTLADTFEKGEGAMYGFQGETQKGYGPELWGITIQQIEDLYNNHPYSKRHHGLSMRDFVRNVIKPITKGKGVGYALLVNQHKPLQAKVMVSVRSSNIHQLFHFQFIIQNIPSHYPSYIANSNFSSFMHV